MAVVWHSGQRESPAAEPVQAEATSVATAQSAPPAAVSPAHAAVGAATAPARVGAVMDRSELLRLVSAG